MKVEVDNLMLSKVIADTIIFFVKTVTISSLIYSICGIVLDLCFRLVQHMSDLLKFITTSSGANVGLLLCEIFRGGPEVCLHLEDKHVKKLLQIILSKQWENRSDVNCILAQGVHEMIVVCKSVCRPITRV